MAKKRKDPPAEWESLLDAAAAALDAGAHHEALQLCDRAAIAGDEARYHAALLRGDVLIEMGDPAGALTAYETVADPDVEDPELDCARGIALFELGRLAEADNALKSAVRGQADLAEGHYVLGLIAEILGTGQEVEHFRKARKLDPERFAPPLQLSREQFEAAVDEALEHLPAPLRAALERVPVLIAELPHADDLKHAEPPLSPLALGLYVGPQLTLNETFLPDTEGQQPAMVLFKRNLERASGTREALVEELEHTLRHEIGHALGLSEEELHEDGP